MLIDAHQHAFWHKHDDSYLVADMDANGIDFAWLLSCEMSAIEDRKDLDPFINPINRWTDGRCIGLPLADQLRARDHYPQRFVAGYCPHPMWCDAAELFDSAYHMYGVRVCGEWKYKMLVDDPRCLLLFRKAGQLGCPVVVHMDVPFRLDPAGGQWRYQDEWYGGTVDNLRRALEACPETIFIGHGPGFWREISGDAQNDPALYPSGPVAPGGKLYNLFAAFSNLHADLSANSALDAIARDPVHGLKFLAQFADRLLFARDTYGTKHRDFLSTLQMPQDVQDKIYFENALRLVPPPS